MAHELDPGELRRTYDSKALSFATTAELAPASGIIGQPRGVQAIEFGLAMRSAGFNIYVLGESGTGRTTAIQQFVEMRAASDPPPNDWVYLHNFAEADRPLAIAFPPGEATTFSNRLQNLIRQLRGEIARAFDNESFRDAVLEVQQRYERRREGLFNALQGAASDQGAALLSTPEGFRIVPARDGQPLSTEEYAALGPSEKEAWMAIYHHLERDLNEAMHQARKLEIAARQELDALQERVAAAVVDGAMAELQALYAGQEKVTAYLQLLHRDIIDNVDLFRVEEDGGGGEDEERPQRFRRYQVNILVDHSASEHAPVIVELDPNLPRLLGRVEHEARRGGAVITDFTLIRPGTLHMANGGYLVIHARDLFSEQGAWDGLKRALVAEAVRPDDPATRRGSAVRTLDPEVIPLALKVILVGPAGLYYGLHDEDEDFPTIFKVMADFDERIERTPQNERAYAAFVAMLVADEGLSHLQQAAVGRVIEFGARLAGTQDKLSTRFGQIADLVREATYWAGQAGRSTVSDADVETAIDHRAFLSNRIETRMRESLREGKQLISTSGDSVGQINGLSVLQVGSYEFGHPSRITARSYVGREGVVQIDREAELTGPIHDKGVMTLVGYLGGRYAHSFPLSLSAQITFEQNYGEIEGDSASLSELYALLSSLGGIPIRQGVAVTGSVNQAGEIQAIGGVTEKVEGWYNVCQEAGLTGEQGVIIPAANAADLMLRAPIVQAVAAGRFFVWAVRTVDEGLETLTGRPAAEVHAAVQKRLEVLAETIEEFGDE